MGYLLSFCAASVLLVSGCVRKHVIPPGPTPDPVVVCDAAEANMIMLGCDGVDTTFSDACEQAMKDGLAWNPDCLARITSCDQLDAAWRGECK